MQVYECVVARPDHLYCVSICFFIFLSVLLIGEIILSRTPPASEHTQWQKISHSLTGSKEQCWQYVRQQAVAAVVAMVTPVTIVNMGCLGQKKKEFYEWGWLCMFLTWKSSSPFVKSIGPLLSSPINYLSGHLKHEFLITPSFPVLINCFFWCEALSHTPSLRHVPSYWEPEKWSARSPRKFHNLFSQSFRSQNLLLCLCQWYSPSFWQWPK